MLTRFDASRRRVKMVRSLIGERGYVTAMTALLLLPMLAFAGLAVDLGGWYARAAAIQRATDAASLAGVALMPLSESQAIQRAREVAAQNGFVHGVDGVTVDVDPVGIDRLRVRINDENVPQYFTTMFRDDVEVARASTAEYIPPVRMGSPRNFLGTGTLSGVLPSGAVRENFMLSINSPCSLNEDGDLLASVRMGFSTPGNSNYCNPTNGAPNPDYNERGYIYGVRFEDGYDGSNATIQVYDAAYCPSGSGAVDLSLSGNSDSFTTRYTVRNPAPNPYTGSIRSTTEARPSDCGSMRGRWFDLHTITSPQPGQTYGIQVQTHSPTTNNRGSANNFALRVRRGTSWQACSSNPHEADPNIPHSNPHLCPNVFAFEHLSIFANVQGSAAEFYLANIGPEHSGKQLIVELFDPGEGGETIRLREPDNSYATFSRTVRRRFPTEVAPADGWGVANGQTSVNINRVGPAPGTHRLTDGRCRTSPTGGPHDQRCIYNERSLRLEVDLPDNITTAYSGQVWWKIRYDFRPGIDVTDRTTWSVSVRGDPVRLVE